MKGSVDATNEVVHFAYQYTGYTPLLELKYLLGELMVFEMTGESCLTIRSNVPICGGGDNSHVGYKHL